jgi:hypothetical protein
MCVLRIWTEGYDPDDLDIMKEALYDVDPQVVCFSIIYPEEGVQLLTTESIPLPDFIFIDSNIAQNEGH